MSLAELKQKALNQLNGKKKNAAITCLVNVIIVGIVDSVAKSIFKGEEIFSTAEGITIKSTHPAASLIILAIAIFLGLGFTSYLMKIARGEEEVKVDELFSKGSIFPKAFVSSILAGLLIGLGIICFIIPGIILALGYSMITYIYIDNPNIGIVDVMKQSREMMKGHKWELFCLELSFIGWMILGIFTLGILYLWLIPYMGVTLVNFYEGISGKAENTPVVEAE